jgi:hypothetical protein
LTPGPAGASSLFSKRSAPHPIPVQGWGSIGCRDGSRASFAFVVDKQAGKVRGTLGYSDPASHLRIVGPVYSAAVSGTQATFAGTCGRSCTFSVTVNDGGPRPWDDSFAITVGAYSAGPSPLSTGAIVVRPL